MTNEKINQEIRDMHRKGISKKQCEEKINAYKRAIAININNPDMQRTINEWKNIIGETERQLKFWQGNLYKFQNGVPEDE